MSEVDLEGLETVAWRAERAEAVAADLREQMQRVREVSGDRAAEGFNEAGRLSRINDIAADALAAHAKQEPGA